MKYNVMIVENELYVRQGIIQTFDWDKLNCRVVADASNGSVAVKIAQKKKIDIIFSDIEMPIMDGIEMLKYLRQNHIDTEVVFFSAYKNFSYVHSALKLDVIDYLLKPFRFEDIEEAINKVTCKRNLQQKDKNVQTDDYLKISVDNEYIEQSIKYVRENYNKELSVAEVSTQLGLNCAYFCRLFKKNTGYTFVQYVTNYKIHLAAHLFERYPMKVHEVANEVGYDDSNYFSLLFKKIMGIAPKDYQYINKKY